LDARPDSRSRHIVTVLARRRWLIAVGALVAVAVSLAVSSVSTKIYAATAKVVADGPAASTDVTSAADASNVATQVQMLKSNKVAVEVSQELGAKAPLVSAIRIKPVGKSRVINVTAESSNKAVAAEAATTYAKVYVEQWREAVVDTRQQLSQTLQQKMQAVKKQLDDVEAKINAAIGGSGNVTELPQLRTDRDSIQAKYNDFKARYDASLTDSNATGTGVRVLEEAATPSGAVRPRPIRNAGLGLVLGLLVGCVAAFVFESADDAVRNADDVRRHALGKRLLGSVPAIRSWRDRDNTRLITAEDPSAPAAEAYRGLRTAVQFALAREPGTALRTVLVTSPTTSEGKSATVANLAIMLARSGRRVVCVDCNLRRPRLHKFFGLESTVGFTSVLLGDSPLSTSVQQVSVAGGGALLLLASGPLPPNPAELLETGRVSELLTAVRANADVVLIDGPPLLPVTDALSLASRVDGVIIASAVHITSRRALAKTLTTLADADASVLGIVLNGVPGGANEPVRAPAAERLPVG
jgi:capsular exopolysaccharide synthesis family protein